MQRYPTLLTRICARYFFFLASLVVAGGALFTFVPSSPLLSSLPQTVVTPSIESSRPNELSGADMGLYALIFEAEDRGDTERSNALMVELENRDLVGYALATRYLGNGYKASVAELQQWLSLYADHPQVPRIARLATQRGVRVSLPKPAQPLRGDGYTDHLGRSTMPDAWFTALGYWREGNYKAAQSLFTRLSKDRSLSDWQQSAAHYWAYRADAKLGDSYAAHRQLQLAAHYPTTFYGLLAATQLGETRLEAKAPEVSDALRADKRAVRAGLLADMGNMDAAETELRALYAATPEAKRGGIVTLVSELGLPNLQMRLARSVSLSPAEDVFAKFPMPHYMRDSQAIDPALLMAVARNESGFREVARSEAGATGMMQMLPSTARMVEKRIGHAQLQLTSASGDMSSIAERLNDPATSARYGAEYLNMLAKLPAVKQNLIHLLVSYNAGAGTLIGWKAASRNIHDPLLFIESIPYAETRNYVMQVSAQYWVYQIMLGEKTTSLTALAHGQWPTLPQRRS